MGPSCTNDGEGIFKWSAGTFTTIAKTTEGGGQFVTLGGPASINSAGFVSFRGILDLAGTPEGAFVGNGATLTTIVTTTLSNGIVTLPAINDAGVVAFEQRFSGADHIFTQSMLGGPTTLIADTKASTPFSTLQPGTPNLPRLSINASGLVAFRAGLKSGINDDGIFIGSGGNVTTKIAQDDDVAPGGLETFVSFSSPSLNDAGAVAFCGGLTSTEAGIFLWKGGVMQVVADTRGTFDGFTFPDTGLGYSQVSMPSVNGAGEVAFVGASNQGGEAIYLWDGTLHRVVGIGDVVDGATITDISFQNGGFNSAADMAFEAKLTGVDPILIARAPRAPAEAPGPAPGPASLFLVGTGPRHAALVQTRPARAAGALGGLVA